MISTNDEQRITLADEADVVGFRAAARRLLAEGVEPARVVWEIAGAVNGNLFAQDPGERPLTQAGAETGAEGSPATAPDAASSPGAIKVPAFFVPLCEHAALHADPARFGLLYRLLWRLVHEPALRDDALDPDRLEAEKMARMVRRDMHKMTAFVRFRPIGTAGAATEDGESVARGDDPHDFASGDAAHSAADDSGAGADADADADAGAGAGSPSSPRIPSIPSIPSNEGSDGDGDGDPQWHVAWFEPMHHIVAATAPFFARRFAQLRWAILTPERCVRWDGRQLAFGPGANRDEAPPADAGEQLWLTYYAHIFNPARLKLSMMQREMPRRYWHNLPEAALIQPLTLAAGRRSDVMIADAGSTPAHRRPAASVALRIDARPGASTSLSSGSSADLPSLGAALNACRECPIGELATQAVPGRGPSGARLMLVGEQPGDQEDLRGETFVGPAGQLLGRAFDVLGWPRDALYVTNAVKHFKYELRGKRRIHKTPGQREAAACLHWLESEIGLVGPEAIVALGATAARALLGRAVGVTAERGRWLARADGLPVLITLHPSALLRMESGDREAAFQAWITDLSAATAHARPA